MRLTENCSNFQSPGRNRPGLFYCREQRRNFGTDGTLVVPDLSNHKIGDFLITAVKLLISTRYVGFAAMASPKLIRD
jgi:hypothetical protein